MATRNFKVFVLVLVTIASLAIWRITGQLPSFTAQDIEHILSSPSAIAQSTATPRAIALVTPRPSSDVLGDETSETPLPSGFFQNEGGMIRQHARIVRIVDGDTVELETGEKLRYIGIDTAETVKPNTPVQCFGKEASDRNKELVEGKIVELEKDVSETDRYGRLLRYVFIDGEFINEYLVKEGYAYAVSYPPDVKYQDMLKEAQREAQANNKGLWGAGCDARK